MSKFIKQTPQKKGTSEKAVNKDLATSVQVRMKGGWWGIVIELSGGKDVEWIYDSEQAARDDLEKLFLA